VVAARWSGDGGMDRPLVIYIMGDGRSGSTVLATLLGNHPEVATVGEITKWPQLEGQPRRDDDKEGLAEFWGDVLIAYQKQHTDTPYPRLVDVQNLFENYDRLPSVLLGLTPRWAREIYQNHAIKLIRAINQVTGKSAVVDSSKRMGRAYMLMRNPYLNVKVIHLVRDPRGALWSQKKRDVEERGKGAFQTLWHYWVKNFFCHLVNWFSPNTRILRVRYEDVSTQSQEVLNKLEDFLGLTLEPLRELLAADRPLVVDHLLDGNRVRRKQEMRLRIDDAWRTGLSGFWKATALLLTCPFSALYGYWRAGTGVRDGD
jgi:hypothetical protein